jgi:hypothetical protein
MKGLVYPGNEGRRMLASDADAFGLLSDRRPGGVYRFALRMSGSAAQV